MYGGPISTWDMTEMYYRPRKSLKKSEPSGKSVLCFCCGGPSGSSTREKTTTKNKLLYSYSNRIIIRSPIFIT